MAAQSTKPACATALTLAALMLAALAFAAQPAMAQVGQPIAVSAEDADGPLDAPPLPEPLTRQAIRDVLSGLSDGQARELLLRELDRRVAAREAALTGAREPALGALLGDWAVALGRGWVSVIQATPTLPGSAAAAFDNFQAEPVREIFRYQIFLLNSGVDGGMLRDTSDAAAGTGRARLIQGSENGWSTTPARGVSPAPSCSVFWPVSGRPSASAG